MTITADVRVRCDFCADGAGAVIEFHHNSPPRVVMPTGWKEKGSAEDYSDGGAWKFRAPWKMLGWFFTPSEHHPVPKCHPYPARKM